MEAIEILYEFELPDASEESFAIRLEPETLLDLRPLPEPLPDWTRLGFEQCPNCPLEQSARPHCPLAARLSTIVAPFEKLVSYDTVHLRVVTQERTIRQETTVQKGLGSLMGLVIATSGCPHTTFLRAMARFHLPLAGVEESAFRAIATFLVARYLAEQEGLPVERGMGRLKEIYENLREVNRSVARRLAAASRSDSSLNAIVKLDLYAIAVPRAIDTSLKDLRAVLLPVLEPIGPARRRERG
jgi:hypothetical protein